MEVLFAISLISLIVWAIVFVGSLFDDTLDEVFYKIFTTVGIILFILFAIGLGNLSKDDGIQEGRIQGAKHPEYYKIQKIDYQKGIPKDTIYVYEVPDLLE